MDTLVSASELANNLDNPDWVIVDCRFSLADAGAGQAAYKEGHIPGAHYVNLEKELSAAHVPGKTGRHPLPEKHIWIRDVQSLGITPEKQVVIYDDAGGAMAARMWWMLRWIGHDNAALLDGGIKAWAAGGYDLSAEPVSVTQAADFDYSQLDSLVSMVETDEIHEGQMLLDARELPRFRGETEPLDPVAGHIPGAICSAFSGNLDDNGFFRSAGALAEKFAPAIDSGKPLVCYCGSGVTAAHNILAMKIAGEDSVALYPGSWSEWITDSTRGVATGD